MSPAQFQELKRRVAQLEATFGSRISALELAHAEKQKPATRPPESKPAPHAEKEPKKF